jgi:GT2 family glycosyltransferase
MTDKPLVSIVMGAYNRLEFLKLAIQSAREETKNIPHEIIVVDGGSDDGSIEWLALQKDVITLIQHNRGEFEGKSIMRRPWGYFMNLTFKIAQADYILMMSDDTVFHTGAVANGLAFVRDQQTHGKKVGAVPFYFHDVHDDPANTYKVLSLFKQPLLNHGIYNREALANVGYADEENYVFYASDSDICFKMVQAGYEIIPCQTACMLHYPNHPTRFMNMTNEKWVRDATAFLNKWRGIFVSPETRVEDMRVENIEITFEDKSGLAQQFDDAFKQAQNNTTLHAKSADSVLLGQIEARLGGILAKTNYMAQLTDQLIDQNRITHEKDHLAWLAFWGEWKAFNRPYYRRMLSTWLIFAPLRRLKNRANKE